MCFKIRRGKIILKKFCSTKLVMKYQKMTQIIMINYLIILVTFSLPILCSSHIKDVCFDVYYIKVKIYFL